MEKMSTGLCNMMLGGVAGAGSLKSIIEAAPGWKLFIFDGAVPATADATTNPSSNLCVVTGPANAALLMDALAVTGVLPKSTTQTWSGNNLTGGTATYYRFQTAGDGNGASGVLPRIQGTIGTGNADMNLGSVILTAGQPFVVNYFVQALVPS